jgi:hypothetical protein
VDGRGIEAYYELGAHRISGWMGKGDPFRRESRFFYYRYHRYHRFLTHRRDPYMFGSPHVRVLVAGDRHPIRHLSLPFGTGDTGSRW